jgi:hypothetical protein
MQILPAWFEPCWLLIYKKLNVKEAGLLVVQFVVQKGIPAPCYQALL